MAWRQSRYYTHRSHFGLPSTRVPFGSIDSCFVRRDHQCGKYLGASKSCFIASPSDEELTPTLDLVTEKLARAGYDAYVAVRERAYGQDIFCTKICGRIIESKFCVVILDDSHMDGTAIPNPNVYYEYGLMTALGKQVIPLQKENLGLAFNIQSHDTIKYGPATLCQELDRAIRDAISLTSRSEVVDRQLPSERTLLRNFEIAGFTETSDRWFLGEALEGTQFKGFRQAEKGFYCFIAKMDREDDEATLFEDLNVLLFRVERKKAELDDELADLASKSASNASLAPFSSYEYESEKRSERQATVKRWLSLISAVPIGIIQDPEAVKPDLRTKCESLIDQYERFSLCMSQSSSIEVGGTHVSLEPFDI